MREVHLEPVVFTARLFKEGESYATGGEYEAVCTIHRMRHIAYITACMGSFDLFAYRELIRQLEAQGITDVNWLRGTEEK